MSPGDDYDPYHELFERSADAILIIEGEHFSDCNAAAVELFRAQSREHVLRTHPSELSPPRQEDGSESREKANRMIARAFGEGVHRFEWMHRRADSTDFLAEVSLTCVREHGRQTLHSVVRDISDKRRLEEELRHTQKMEALGKLAGGIAHDFNNLLVAILGHAELLSMDLADEPARLAHVDQIRGAGERAADLVRQLLIFGRKDQHRAHVFDLAELVRESDKLMRRLIGEDVQLALDAGTLPLPVRADASQIQQVILNLASNARDAMPRGGRFELALCRVALGAGEFEGLPAGRYARLTVSDSGHGMDAETLRRAFDPFFTTKEVGKGTGLGLATAHGVVEGAGGRIMAESTRLLGTSFQIHLPLAAARAEPTSKPPALPIGGDETLLLVEDDYAVSALLVDALEAAGYRILHARDGLEALAIFHEREEELDLILSDVIMPGMSGPEMLRLLAREGHSPRALLMSGYTGDALSRTGEPPPGVELLHKPFAPALLLQRVRQALDRED